VLETFQVTAVQLDLELFRLCDQKHGGYKVKAKHIKNCLADWEDGVGRGLVTYRQKYL